jgi:hypothetical protein
MLNTPQLHIKTTDRPYLGLFFCSNQLIHREHFTKGHNVVKITSNPEGNKTHIQHIICPLSLENYLLDYHLGQ